MVEWVTFTNRHNAPSGPHDHLNMWYAGTVGLYPH